MECNRIEDVNNYNYLGIVFAIKLKWTSVKKKLASQAKKVSARVNQIINVGPYHSMMIWNNSVS